MATARQEVLREIEPANVARLSLVKYEELEPETVTLAAQAETLVVIDDATLERAGELIKDAHGRKKFIEDVFEPMRVSAKNTYDEVRALIQRATEPLEKVKDILSTKGSSYLAERERRMREEAQRRELIAKQQAEEQALAQAAEAERMGDKELAAQILAEGVDPLMQPSAPSADYAINLVGLKYTEHWSAEVIDLAKLVKAVAEGKQPITLLAANQTALNQMARAQKGAMNVPGVRPVKKENLSPTGK